MITIKGIHSVRQNKLPEELTISLNAGEGLGIFGPNGSGKSTLLDIIAGILPSKEAQIGLNGTLGYAMQKDGFHETLSCLDNLILEANYAQLPKNDIKARIAQCAQQCGVSSFLKVKVAKLSAGMRARLSLAASLICDPQVLLMDESFNALDEQSVIEIKDMLIQKKHEGLSIIFVTHNREEFNGLCEKILHFPSLKDESL